jgi:hypothetical protein
MKKSQVCRRILRLLFSVLPLLAVVPASAQTAEIMDRIIASPGLDLTQATYMVFVASGKLAEDSSTDQAYALVQDLKWLADTGNPVRQVKISEFAYLMTRAFGLPTSLLGQTFPGPRYSYRALVFRGLIPPNIDPESPVSGSDAVRILGKVMDTLPQGANP